MSFALVRGQVTNEFANLASEALGKPLCHPKVLELESRLGMNAQTLWDSLFSKTTQNRNWVTEKAGKELLTTGDPSTVTFEVQKHPGSGTVLLSAIKFNFNWYLQYPSTFWEELKQNQEDVLFPLAVSGSKLPPKQKNLRNGVAISSTYLGIKANYAGVLDDVMDRLAELTAVKVKKTDYAIKSVAFLHAGLELVKEPEVLSPPCEKEFLAQSNIDPELEAWKSELVAYLKSLSAASREAIGAPGPEMEVDPFVSGLIEKEVQRWRSKDVLTGKYRHNTFEGPYTRWERGYIKGLKHGMFLKNQVDFVPELYAFGELQEIDFIKFEKEGYDLYAYSLDGKTILDARAKEVYPDGSVIVARYLSGKRGRLLEWSKPGFGRWKGPVINQNQPDGEGTFYYAPQLSKAFDYFKGTLKNGKPIPGIEYSIFANAEKKASTFDKYEFKCPLDENFLPHAPGAESLKIQAHRKKVTTGLEHGKFTTAVIDYEVSDSRKAWEWYPISYTGEIDEDLQPHGKGSMQVYEGNTFYQNTFTGEFKHGKPAEGNWKSELYARQKNQIENQIELENSIVLRFQEKYNYLGKPSGLLPVGGDIFELTLSDIKNGFAILVIDNARAASFVTYEVVDYKLKPGYSLSDLETNKQISFEKPDGPTGPRYAIIKVTDDIFHAVSSTKVRIKANHPSAKLSYLEIH